MNYFTIYCNDKHEAAMNILLQWSNSNYFIIYGKKKYEKFNYYNKYTIAIIWIQIIFINSLKK